MKGFFKSIWKKIKRLILIAFLLHAAYLVALIWIQPPLTITMLSNSIRGYGMNYEPISYNEQGKQIKLAAIASEDQKFPSHHGIDFEAVKSAFASNAKGEKIRGGSTITQQTAKNVFLWQGRDWVRKGLEAYSALVIELVWGKERILQHYLNIAEMGEGIYGVKAAAKKYYNTTPDKLSADQAATLIASLPSPKVMNPNKQTKKLLKKKKWILRQMKILAKHDKVKAIISD